MVYVQTNNDPLPTPGKNTNYLAWIVVVVLPLCALLWYLAPVFLPVWRWQNMDFVKLSKALDIPKDTLQTQYDVTMRYAPRGVGDPAPWQIMTQFPLFKEEEDKMWVRCSFVSDRTGESVSDLQLGSGTRFDKFWKAKVWRFPPGAFGRNAKRPVLIYDASTLDGFTKDEARMQEIQFGMGQEPNDKEWISDNEDVDDGYVPPSNTPAEEAPADGAPAK